jgi:hypothetical protein
LHLSIHTSGSGGSAELDGQKIADITDGSLEYDLPSDAVPHKLTVSENRKQLFAFNVQGAAGQQPQVTGFDASDLLVITSLGKDATLYGKSTLGTAHLGDQGVVITPSGAPITLTDQSHDLVFGAGEDQGSVSIELSNAPTLLVQSLGGQGRVLITANADNATLTVDSLPVPRQGHGWTVNRPPGTHKFVLSAIGYDTQSWTMTIQRHGTVSKNMVLSKVSTPTVLAGINFTACTPGAEVAVDGRKAGELDPSGNLNLPHIVEVGRHAVTLTKPGYETREVEVTINPASSGKPPVDAQISKVTLVASNGTLAFEGAVKGTTVKYRRVGDSEFKDASPSEKLPLQPGQYEIVAERPGYKKFTTTMNLAREDVIVSLNLTPIPDYEFEDPTQIAHEGGWIKSKTAGKFINLRPGLLSANLVFERPHKTLLWEKKVEWTVENSARSARVQYSLEGQGGKLTRKLVIGQEASDQREAKADAQAGSQNDSLSLHIRVQGGQVRITNDKGAVLDEFAAPGQDFSNGRIAVRSESHFLVRSNND